MRVAFIVLAHKRPDLVGRLVRTLDRPVGIHIDAKVRDIQPFRASIKNLPDVHFLQRNAVGWGDFGVVQATLTGLRWFLETDADYVFLLTGQCYPLWPIPAIERRLSGLNGKSIIHHIAFPYPYWHDGGINRLDRFYIRLFGKCKAVHLWNRRLPANLTPFGGSTYWCLSRDCVRYICDTLERIPQITRFFRTTLIPDEVFFQTLLANSPFRDRLINSETHYLTFKLHAPHPSVISDPTDAIRSGKWFARKLEDATVLDDIDEFRRSASRRGVLPYKGDDEEAIAARHSTTV